MIRLRAISLLAVLAPAASLRAQAAPAKAACSIDLMQPGQLGIVSLKRSQVMSAKTPEESGKAIKDAIKALNDDKITKENPLGRNLMLGQFFILAATNKDVQTRDALGLPGDKNATVDLIVAADSVFSIVEKAQPACSSETEPWREYKPYGALIAAGYKAITAGQTDSAEKLVKRASLLTSGKAQLYDLQWQIALKRNDEAGQVRNLQAAADKLKGDTTNNAVRANFLFTLGRIQQGFAAQKSDKAQKAELQRSAAKAFLQVLDEYPTSEEAPFAMNGVSIASAVASDTAIAGQAVDMVKRNLGKFTDATLAQAGVMATSAGRTADAVLLFEAASKANPYMRDYLYNYAAMLHEAKRDTEMPPVVKQLVALDPSNPDNVMLFAYAFKGVSDAEKDAKVKKALIDSVVAYSKLSDEMPHRVAYEDFSRGRDKTTVHGMIENRAKTARSFSVDFEFLGKDGSVVGKQTVTAANVAPGGSSPFTLEIPTPAGGVYGLRYAPLPLK